MDLRVKEGEFVNNCSDPCVTIWIKLYILDIIFSNKSFENFLGMDLLKILK